MGRFLLAAIALSALMCASALACEGQVGKVIYEDTFADDSGGWDLSPPIATIKPPNFVIALDAKSWAISSQVLTFHAKEADYCLEGTVPKAPAPDNNASLGLEFWATDYKNFWLSELGSNGTVSLWMDVNGSWTNIATVPNAPGFKPDASNALRVTTLGGKIVISLNGQPVKTVRAQVPESDQLRFGLYGQLDKPADGAPPILVTSYKVTSGQ
jgi:hypothetical protein